MMHEIDILNLASGLAAHAGRRQAVIAQNVAHADTPGYRARELTPFAETFAAQAFRGDSPSPAFVARATRAGHALPDAESVAGTRAEDRFITALGAASPNGNTVSLETEMIKGIEAKRQHDRALAIYRSSLGILRTSLGR